MAIKFQGFTHTLSVQPSELQLIIEQKGTRIDLEKLDTCSNGIDFFLERFVVH